MGFLTPHETAARLGVCAKTVHRGCNAYLKRWLAQTGSAYEPPDPEPGEIPCILVGRRKRIPVTMLERMGLVDEAEEALLSGDMPSEEWKALHERRTW